MLSLQTMDTETLTTIRRSNIKTEKYDALAEEFRRADLPLFVDLMMGLPGQTVESFRHDLQDTLEREVVAKIHTTTLLMNSPMNDPEYKKLHRIEVLNSTNLGLGSRVDQTVVASSTFSRDDYATMKSIRRNFLLLENFGVLRHVARVVRHETGRLEEDLYETVRRTPRAPSPSAGRPSTSWSRAASDVMAPPVSWRLFIDEVHRLLVDDLGVPDDSALGTALQVQHALLPAPGPDVPGHVRAGPRLRGLAPGHARRQGPGRAGVDHAGAAAGHLRPRRAHRRRPPPRQHAGPRLQHRAGLARHLGPREPRGAAHAGAGAVGLVAAWS